MRYTVTLLALAASSFIPTFAQQQINQCPTTEARYKDAQGRAWAICANSDYQGASDQVIGNINSNTDCTSRCAGANGYTKCVYDKINKYCHVKSNGALTWTTSTQFDSSRLVSTVADRTAIDKCPTTETTVTDDQNRVWTICPYSDFHGPTIQVIPNVNSNTDCQKRCQSDSNCKRAVYDAIYNYCHTKGDGQSWVASTQFDTVRLTGSAVPDRTAIDKCPSPESTITDSKGRNWIFCPNSDFWGSTIQVIANVASNADCQKRCEADGNCKRAVFDKIYNTCHTKGDGQAWMSSSKQFDTVRLANTQIPSDWKCSGQQSVVTTSDGSTWALCTNTDWQGRSIYAFDNYQTAEACAEACSLTPICSDAVWDKQYKYCHMKDTKGGLTQANNNQFDQLRLIKKVPPSSQAVNTGGKWSDKVVFPVVPAAAYVVPQQPYANRVMAFSAAADYSFAGSFGKTQFADWNYQSGAMSKLTVQNTNHDMFCPGISSLQNGKIVVTGGNDAAVTSIYDPATGAFVRAPDMKMARGYQSSTTLSNGKVFTIGGSFTGGITTKNGEVYDPSSNTWTFLDGCKADALNTRDNGWRRDNHAWLFGWTDGSVFQAGPSGQMNWYRTANGGSTTSAGVRNSTRDAMCGTNVMYDTGKILAAGGAPFYDNNSGVTTAQVISVPQVGQTASAKNVQDMKYPRMFANSVVLPDGSVLVTGGQKFGRGFNDVESILQPELYNPKTETWKVMNSPVVPRNYHSVSLLLGDGRVMAAGGGLCYTARDVPDTPQYWQCEASAQHPDAEIFSPPYLFNADGSAATRPSITALTTSNDGSGNWVRPGGTLTATIDTDKSMTFSVVRLGSATHSINSDQRRLSVTTTKNGNKHTIKLPSDSGVLLPGYWFLFAMNEQGTPSMGRVIQVRV